MIDRIPVTYVVVSVAVSCVFVLYIVLGMDCLHSSLCCVLPSGLGRPTLGQWTEGSHDFVFRARLQLLVGLTAF